MSVVQEFKSFAMRGNVIDLAVGVVIGGAFGAIISSLVGDIIMPVIGVATGGVDFTKLALTVGDASIAYGKFIQAIFIFTVVAFSLFLIVKGMNSLKKKEEAIDTATAELASDVKLLTEIRDLLKK